MWHSCCRWNSFLQKDICRKLRYNLYVTVFSQHGLCCCCCGCNLNIYSVLMMKYVSFESIVVAFLNATMASFILGAWCRTIAKLCRNKFWESELCIMRAMSFCHFVCFLSFEISSFMFFWNLFFSVFFLSLSIDYYFNVIIILLFLLPDILFVPLVNLGAPPKLTRICS